MSSPDKEAFLDNVDEHELSPKAREGQRIVWIIAGVFLFNSAAAIIVYVVRLGPHKLDQQLVRFAITVALCAFLCRGHRWARWVTAVLAAIAGALRFVVGIKIGMTFLAIYFYGMTLAYSAIAGILVNSAAVRQFFQEVQQSEQEKRREAETFDPWNE